MFDRTVTLSEWRRPDGHEVVLGPIPVDEEEELSPLDACDDLAPDEEHFREATGNEGASFERSYKRAALVLWPSERLFAVLSQAGLPVTLPYFEDLTRRWIEGGGTQQSPLWREAHDLVGHMLAQWPTQGGHGRHKTPSDAARMLATLTGLDDVAAIESVLADVTAEGCYEQGDNDASSALFAAVAVAGPSVSSPSRRPVVTLHLTVRLMQLAAAAALNRET